MSRIIKFRGWHTKLNQMFSAEEMAQDQLTLLPTGQFINVSGVSTKLSKINAEMIPLQFTGLHDSLRKEIYEGDILGAVQANNFTGGQVAYHNGLWLVQPILDDDWASDLWRHIESTVIGNIFEPPIKAD